jgi:uncharacterized protein
VASKSYPDKGSFMREVIRQFNARMKVGLKPAIRNIYADGDTVIIFFDDRDVARDDKAYANTYDSVYDSVEFNDVWARVEPVYQ